MHSADVAELIENLPNEYRAPVIDLLDVHTAAEVVAELDDDAQLRVIEALPQATVARIIAELESDDAADLLGILGTERAQVFMRRLSDLQKRDLEELLAYDEESAGGVMAKEAITALDTDSVSVVIDKLRKGAEKIDDIYNVYLVDSDRRLKGIASMKDLILARQEQLISEIMDADFHAVNVNMDREEAASQIQRYDLASAPVVDDGGRFLGRITHDDVLDIIAEEVNEDIAFMTGQGQFDPGERSFFRNLQHRLPWLLLGLLGGMGAAMILAHYEPQLQRLTALVFFLPIVAAMGGNSGIQTSSLLVRGLATGEISSLGLTVRVLREIGVATANGIVCGGLLFGTTWLWQRDLMLAVVVGMALLVVITVAALVGVVVPLSLKKFGLDPALATGPFITTTNDIFGLFIYLGISTIALFHSA